LTLTYGESAVYIVTFGDRSAGTVRKSWVEYFFGEFSQLFPSYFRYNRDFRLPIFVNQSSSDFQPSLVGRNTKTKSLPLT
jgi:hypothetical protein